MNILFLSLSDKKGLFKNVSISFDRRWIFSVDEETHEVRCVRRLDETIPCSTTLLPNKTPVENLNVIVGANGSGKTSLAALLAKIDSDEESTAFDYTIVFSLATWCGVKKHEKWYCKARRGGDEVEFAIKGEGLVDIADYIPQDKKNVRLSDVAKFVYISPCFTIESPLPSDGGWFKDISTSGLFMPEKETATQDLLSVMGQMTRNTRDVFVFQERLHVVEFIRAYYQCRSTIDEGVGIPIPYELVVAPSEICSQKLLVKLIELRDEYIKKGETSLMFEKMISMLKHVGNGDIYVSFYLLNLVAVGYEYQLPENNSPGNTVGGLRALIDRWHDGYTRQDIEHDFNECRDLDTDFVHFMRLIGRAIDSGLVATRGEREELIARCKDLDSHTNQLSNQFILLHDILECYRAQIKSYPIIKIDFAPVISSGEMSFLTMFGRVYHYVLGLGASGGKVQDNIVMFLDEIETTLHPQWQREIVWNWLWFLERFAENKSVHLIFATHSPLLLSDIPASNVIFLERKSISDGKEVEPMTVVCAQERVIKKSLDVSDTFFANIQDLYALPFVLKNGVVGKRAEMLLREALNKKFKIKFADRKRVVENIGDPIVRSVALETLRLGGYEGGKR